MRLQVYVQNNKKTIAFDNRQSGKFDMYLRKATIFWRFKNIKKNNNDIITDSLGTRIDIISEGYHSFQDLQEIFKANNITMAPNYHDNTCSITPTAKNIELGNLGVMLGFDKDKTFTKDVQSDGTNPVDVHHGLRYVKLSSDIVDKSNVSFEGQRSDVLATLPVETSQRLFSSRTIYSGLDHRVPIIKNFSTIELKLETNIDEIWPYIELDALLDLDIK